MSFGTFFQLTTCTQCWCRLTANSSSLPEYEWQAARWLLWHPLHSSGGFVSSALGWKSDRRLVYFHFLNIYSFSSVYWKLTAARYVQPSTPVCWAVPVEQSGERVARGHLSERKEHYLFIFLPAALHSHGPRNPNWQPANVSSLQSE